MPHYYGNDLLVPGSLDHTLREIRPTAAYYIPHAKAVLRVNQDTSTRYPSVKAAALAAGVKQNTMSSWIKDGKAHAGFTWKFEE